VTADRDDDTGRGPGDVLGSPRDEAAPGLLSRLPLWWRAVGVAALLGLAAVVGPDLFSDDAAVDPDAAASVSPTPTRPAAAARFWPVGGDLADDASFLTAVLRRVRTDHPEADRVLYAGSLHGGGWVAYVGRDRDEPEGIRALDVFALRAARGDTVETGKITLIGRGLIESSGLPGPT